jgi:small subunit ribosomal protein S4e
MAKKGEAKSEKRLAASRLIPLKRKENAWHIKSKPGPHKKRNSVALGFVLRDMLEAVKNRKEARSILNESHVLVDGKVAKDIKRPIGLFDLVTIIPEKKTFRLLFSKKGKLRLAEEEFKQNQKLCKVVGKRKVAKDAVQLTTNDGRTLTEKKTDVSVGDSLLIQLPEQKVLKVIKEQPKKIVLVVDGKHIGDVAKVKDITPGTMSRPKLVTLKTKDGEFKTVESNIIIVGEEKPLIKVE